MLKIYPQLAEPSAVLLATPKENNIFGLVVALKASLETMPSNGRQFYLGLPWAKRVEDPLNPCTLEDLQEDDTLAFVNNCSVRLHYELCSKIVVSKKY